MNFSIIVPVFNRPDEVEELFESLAKQTSKNFEILVVEDGSTEKCDTVVEQYIKKLDIKYFFKENEKPAIARNYGAARASGDYFIFFDSDCIIPENYFKIVTEHLKDNYTDAYGGPDAARSDFNNLQKAISYAMTSFFTTGGIRGNEKIDKFYPRSFNMGISSEAFQKIGGFPVTKMWPGEDMVFSIEIIKQGFKTQLIKEACVFHKRRNNFKTFYKQVFRFGKTRWIISKVYPETFKIFYFAPTVFVLGFTMLIIFSVLLPYLLIPAGLYILLLFIDSLAKNKDISVAFLSVAAGFTQLFGYGTGFLKSFLKIELFNKDEYGVLKNGFYNKEKSE